MKKNSSNFFPEFEKNKNRVLLKANL